MNRYRIADLCKGTSEVIPYRFTHSGYDITLIDTPGFNDTLRSETQVLKDIADFLEQAYKSNIRLNGIIYLQALTDRKMYGSSLRNLKMFRELCGEDPLKSVILATTGWGEAKKADKLDKAMMNEKQLQTDPDFWQPLIKRGAAVERFMDTEESALEMILKLGNRTPVILKIQRELVDDSKDLIDTSAGQAVNEEIKKLEAKYKAEVLRMQQEIDEAIAAHDEDMREALEESRQAFERRLSEVQEQQRMLQYARRNEQRALQDEIEEMSRELKREAEQQETNHRLALEAQRIEDRMHFEEIVAQLRLNEGKIREEERRFLEQRIREMETKPPNKRRGAKLLIGLAPMLGSVAMSLLGFPVMGDPFSGLVNAFNNN